MKIEFRPIKKKESESVYSLFQSLPAEENGAGNDAYGLTRSEFSKWCQKRVKNSIGLELPKNHVASTLFVLFIDNTPVGRVSLRHKLVPHVGHIGRYIAPKFRGKGYGSIILTEALKQAKKMGINKVSLICNENNVASYKTTEQNGGILEKIENGIRYYWITI